MKRSVCIIALALCMCFVAVLPGFAVVRPEEDVLVELSEKTLQTVTLELQQKAFDSILSATYFTTDFYSILAEDSKAVYNALKNISPTNPSVNIVLMDDARYYYYDIGNNADVAVSHAGDVIYYAFAAYLLDNPSFFWSEGLDVQFSLEGVHYSSSVGAWYCKLASATLTPKISSIYNGKIVSLYNQLLSAVDSVPIQNGTRYQILMQIYSYLADSVTYDLYATYAHEPVGSLLYGRAVCEGYAEAFKLLCDRFNIPCICIVGDAGGAHMWNAVQMDDGVFYLVDVTWGDTEVKGNINENYFLVGENTVCNSGKPSETFGSTHYPNGNILGHYTLPHPKFARQAYARVAGDVDGDHLVDITDLALLAQYVAGWSVPIRRVSAEVTGDAAIGVEDLACLAQYIAGWGDVMS